MFCASAGSKGARRVWQRDSTVVPHVTGMGDGMCTASAKGWLHGPCGRSCARQCVDKYVDRARAFWCLNSDLC
eukprot:1727301-Prymnesium_polylepis.2